MEMIVVVPPRPHLGEPRAISAGLLTQHLFDSWVYEDSIDLWV